MYMQAIEVSARAAATGVSTTAADNNHGNKALRMHASIGTRSGNAIHH
jgi:hypothetical protein